MNDGLTISTFQLFEMFPTAESAPLAPPGLARGSEGEGQGAQSMTDTLPILVECPRCGCWHRRDYRGHCRDDSERYAGPDEYAERHGLTETEARALDWQAISLEDREEEE